MSWECLNSGTNEGSGVTYVTHSEDFALSCHYRQQPSSLSLHALSLARNRFLIFNSGATPAHLLATGMATELCSLHTCTCVKTLLGPGIVFLVLLILFSYLPWDMVYLWHLFKTTIPIRLYVLNQLFFARGSFSKMYSSFLSYKQETF